MAEESINKILKLSRNGTTESRKRDAVFPASLFQVYVLLQTATFSLWKSGIVPQNLS